MNAPTIHGKRKPLTAYNVLDAVGKALSKCKCEDELRWVDVGEILGVSDDQAAKYADASAAMNVVAYSRARVVWGSRFTGRLDGLVEGWRPEANAHQAQSCVLRAALALAEALEDGELTVQEIHANRSTLEKAQDAIAAQLARIGPKGDVA